MLLQIHHFMKREKIASNQQLARELGIDVLTLEPMLAILIKKNWIAVCQAPSAGCQQRCFKCQVPPVYYRIV